MIWVLATVYYDSRYKSWWDLLVSSYIKWDYFYGDAVITKINSPSFGYNRYDVQDQYGRNWIFRSKNEFEIWDVLQISANVKLDKYLNQTISWSDFSDKIDFLDTTIESIDSREYTFDYDMRMKMKWYVWTLYDNHTSKIWTIWDDKNKDILSSIQSYILGIRSYVKSAILSSYGENKLWGLMLGMIVGDRSFIPKQDYDDFIDSGLVHLIAVSGGNISMIVIFLSFVLFFLPYYIRIFFILMTIVLYSLVCGLDSSVMRAVIMWSLTIFAIYTGRVTDGFRVLGLALVGMLLYNPYFLIYDIGFVLSFMATLGILLTTKLDIVNKVGFIWKYKIVRYIIMSYIIPSIWAIIGILPILLLYNGYYNLTWFVWNLLVVPLVPIIMIGGALIWVYSYTFTSLISDSMINIWINMLSWVYEVSYKINEYALYLKTDSLVAKIFILIIFWYMMYSLYIYDKK